MNARTLLTLATLGSCLGACAPGTELAPPTQEAPAKQAAPRRQPPVWRPLQRSIPTYALELSPADWKLLNDNIYVEGLRVPGKVSYAGRSWDVEVNLRGYAGRQFPKRGFHLRFPDADQFFGRKHVELHSEYKDGGMLTEKLWGDLAAAAGLVMPFTRYVNLDLNGQRYGLMLDVERVDRDFLRAHSLAEGGTIYQAGIYDSELRAGSAERYQEPWSKHTNHTQPFDELWAFLEKVSRTPNHQLLAFLEAELNLEAYLTWLAVDALIANDLVMDSRSLLLRDARTGKWTYVPRGLSNANSIYSRFEELENQWNGAVRQLLGFTVYDPQAYTTAEERRLWPLLPDARPAWSVLATRVYDVPELRARLIAKLRGLLESHFVEEDLDARIDATRALLAPALAKDPFVDQAYASRSGDFLKRFVRERRTYLTEAISALERHGDTLWKIDRVGQDAQGDTFVELVNTSDLSVSPAGLLLTARLRSPSEQRLLDIEVPPKGVLRLEKNAADPRLALAIDLDPLAPEVGLFAQDGRTALDVLYLDRLSPGEAYGRVPRGAETFGRVPSR